MLPRFDFLQIDTEGYDYEVIKSVPFDRCKPKIIQYENKHISDTDHRMWGSLLIEQGCTVVVYDGDALAYLSQ